MFTVANLVNVHYDLWPWMTFCGSFESHECANRLSLLHDARQWSVVKWNSYCKSISDFENSDINLTLGDLDSYYFKVKELEIVCGVSPLRDGSMFAAGHLISFDDLDLQEDWFGAMSRSSQQQLDFLFYGFMDSESPTSTSMSVS